MKEHRVDLLAGREFVAEGGRSLLCSPLRPEERREGISSEANVEAIQRDQQITLSQQDFKAFHAAIAQPFEPNAALQDALEQACTRVSRV